MTSTFTIQLNNLRFYAPHGLYAEEAQLGNEFEVNIALEVKAPKSKLTSIEQTVNYAEVYRLVKDLFAVRNELLESLAMEIAATIKQTFSSVRRISVQITKCNPPIASFTGSVSVTYNRIYKGKD